MKPRVSREVKPSCSKAATLSYQFNDGRAVYEDYYRFTRHPFSLTPDPEFLRKSKSKSHQWCQTERPRQDDSPI